MIIDRLGRRFSNLRVSLTAACNYACTYCVPDGKKLQPASMELKADQMLRLVELLVDAGGIEKLRITGGEPLLSRKFEAFIRGVMQLPLNDVSITTNGQFLPRYVNLFSALGLKRINVSLDTLDANRFRAIARSGDLKTVLDGIDQVIEQGMKVKINTVPLRTENLDQLLPLLDYALDRGIELRYIELMNMGHLKRSNLYAKDFIGMNEILDLIATKYKFKQAFAPFDSTSIRYKIPDRGYFGIIANETEPFCRTCSRLRLSSNGSLYGCLSNTKNYDLTPLLSLPDLVAVNELQGTLRSALGDKQSVAFTGETTVMKFIGG